MAPLRRRMIDDMRIRNLAPLTQTSYVQQVSLFARHFGQPRLSAWAERRSRKRANDGCNQGVARADQALHSGRISSPLSLSLWTPVSQVCTGFDHSHKFRRLCDFHKLRRRREPFERRAEHCMGVRVRAARAV